MPRENRRCASPTTERRAMAQVGARMLILDEINHMLSYTPPRQQRIFLSTLRYHANDLQNPIVCTDNHGAQAGC